MMTNATPGVRYRFLLGGMHQLNLSMTVRFFGVPEEAARIPEIIQAWRAASTRMQSLVAPEAGVADTITIQDPPPDLASRLKQIASDPLFSASFSDLPTTFKIVQIDKLVAAQRDVNLDYVDVLRGRLARRDLPALVEFCLAPRAEPPEIKTIQTAQNQITFSSASLDLRFLGGFPKPITEEDIAVAHIGGQPVQVVTLLVGFSATPINGWLVERRVVLANGFHRIVALRSEGITQVPMVVRHVTNIDIEFPSEYLGLPRSYFLQQPRPVLVKDFFDPQLTLEVRLKPRRKTLKLAWGPDEGIVPE